MHTGRTELCARIIQDLMIYVDMSQGNLFVLSNYVMESRPEMQNLVLRGQPILPRKHHDIGVRHRQLKLKDGARVMIQKTSR